METAKTKPTINVTSHHITHHDHRKKKHRIEVPRRSPPLFAIRREDIDESVYLIFLNT
jgi:hypothetical protein